MVGAGAGGVEITFCLPAHLERNYPGCPFELSLVDAGVEILPGTNAGTIRHARRRIGGPRRSVDVGP